jgi:hypothetical protein
MTAALLLPCPGCGALYPPSDGPTHRYLGASAGCFALFSWYMVGNPEVSGMLAESRIPEMSAAVPPAEPALDILIGDAYGVQHHGEESPQAIQSVAVHFLDLHAVITGQTKTPGWAIKRALRIKGVFHKLVPPTQGSALTIRHLFPGGGVGASITRSQYVRSVYDTWMALHGATIALWYERYVVQD